MRLLLTVVSAAAVMASPLPAMAACQETSPTFASGAKFAGEIRDIVDGQTICVGRTPDPDAWVRVRLADLDLKKPDSRSARGELRRQGLGKYAVCTVAEQPARAMATDPVHAICRVAGVSLGGRIRHAR